VPADIFAAREQIVEPKPNAELQSAVPQWRRNACFVERHQKLERFAQMRRKSGERRALVKSFPDERELEVFEVAQPSVNELG